MRPGIQLSQEYLEGVVLGEAVLGGGGGGSIAEGLRLGRAALAAGASRLAPLEALPDEAEAATASLVGSPASRNAVVEAADPLRAWQMLSELARTDIGGDREMIRFSFPAEELVQ